MTTATRILTIANLNTEAQQVLASMTPAEKKAARGTLECLLNIGVQTHHTNQKVSEYVITTVAEMRAAKTLSEVATSDASMEVYDAAFAAWKAAQKQVVELSSF